MFKKYGTAHECSAKARSKQQLMSQIRLPGLHHLAYYLPKHFCMPKHPIICQITCVREEHCSDGAPETGLHRRPKADQKAAPKSLG